MRLRHRGERPKEENETCSQQCDEVRQNMNKAENEIATLPGLRFILSENYRFIFTAAEVKTTFRNSFASRWNDFRVFASFTNLILLFHVVIISIVFSSFCAVFNFKSTHTKCECSLRLDGMEIVAFVSILCRRSHWHESSACVLSLRQIDERAKHDFQTGRRLPSHSVCISCVRILASFSFVRIEIRSFISHYPQIKQLN